MANLNNYISLDILYSNYSDHIDSITLLLSVEDINIEYFSDIEYIKKEDYSKIENILNEKRMSKEIIIGKRENKLISYNVKEM